MKGIQKLFFILILVFFITASALAESFVLQRIEVRGVQKVTESTVLSYIPVQIGQEITTQDGADILKALYATGFFTDVGLERKDNTLVVIVHERPTIGAISVKGNKEITEKQLEPVLKKLDLIEGEIFNSVKLHILTQSLIDQYHDLGYLGVKVDSYVTPMPRNRVAVRVDVTQGPMTKITKIRIVGNHVVPEQKLLKNFTSTTSAWYKLTFFTNKDRYSRSKLDEDLQHLTDYYLDIGYLHFRVVDVHDEVSADGKSVTIVVTVDEGPKFTLSGLKIEGGFDSDKMEKAIKVTPGEAYSKGKIQLIEKIITAFYSNQGYALAKVAVENKVNEKNHSVFVIYHVDTGPLVYVRQIHVGGNEHTNEAVLRNRMRQMEASPYSKGSIEESKRRLANLPYFKDVTVESVPVEGQPDQVDLNYHVTEVNAGKASVQGGWSDTEGLLYGANLSEPNFLGSGKLVSLGFQSSQFQDTYSFEYEDPYYTPSGISRGFTVFYTQTDPSLKLNQASYTMDTLGGVVTYGIPISTFDRISFGFGYSHMDLSGGMLLSPPPFQQFVRDHPDPYNQFRGIVSWSHSTLDRAIYPTKGLSQIVGAELGIPIIDSSLSYYRVTSDTNYYYPLGLGFIFSAYANLGYGNGYGDVDTLPFFYNFYAGGLNTLPGYQPNSLGPKNPWNGGALGGNLKLIGGLKLILPPIIHPSVRTALLVAGGNIFDTNKVQLNPPNPPIGNFPVVPPISYEAVTLGNVRWSAGLLVSWLSPLGPLEAGVAQAINRKKQCVYPSPPWNCGNDQVLLFDFTFGTSI